MSSEYNSALGVNTEQLRNLIEQYNKERDNLESIFSNYSNDIKTMNDYWSGDNGDEASNRLNKYSSTFEPIINKLTNNINFLERVVAAYENYDRKLSSNVDTNLNN